MYIKKALFIASGFIPLLGLLGTPPTFMLLLYSIFVLCMTRLRERWQVVPNANIFWTIFSTAILVLFLTETLAWIHNYAEGFINPGALYSTNYIADLVIGSGFYIGMAVAWFLVGQYFAFSAKQAFITYGLMGIFIEQSGAIAKQAIALAVVNPAIAIFLVLYVFFAHGSIAGLMQLRMAPRMRGVHIGKIKYFVALAAIFIIGAVIGSVASEIIAKVLSLQ